MEQPNYELVPNKENNMNWAANIQKLRRAEAMKPGASEEEIKEAYVKMGGKLLEDETPPVEESTAEPDTTEEIVEEIKPTEDETPPVAPKKTRRSKK